MHFYITVDEDGRVIENFDDISHPPVIETVRVQPVMPPWRGEPEDMPMPPPQSEWPTVQRWVRRNDTIPESAIEITEADRAEYVSAPQFARWDGSKIVVSGIPVITDPLPPPISDRQFFQQLAMDGVITEDEALATSDGTMPQLLMDTIAMLPAEQQFGAKMLAKNATQFERNNPLVSIIGARLGWDEDRLNKLWADASRL